MSYPLFLFFTLISGLVAGITMVILCPKEELKINNTKPSRKFKPTRNQVYVRSDEEIAREEEDDKEES